ncbi:3-phenylpropionate-dihydrodiol/cinnamic acid-dihydrodiol dehydrogenase [Streptomyces tendae]
MKRLVTVVTGGGRGIGAATCRRLAAEGHDVAVNYVRDAGAAEKVAEDVRAAGARAVTVRADTSDEADVERLFEVTERELGPLTGLVNNAAVTGPLGPFTEVATDTLRRVVDVNVVGTLLCARRAAQLMTPRGTGVIVNISSGAATLGSPGEYVHYAATKAAVDALTVGLSKELGPSGVRVNAVAPGLDRHGDARRDGGAGPGPRDGRDHPAAEGGTGGGDRGGGGLADVAGRFVHHGDGTAGRGRTLTGDAVRCGRQAASTTRPRMAAAHSTTSISYSSRSWADREPPARSHRARICSFTSAADRTEPGGVKSGDMRTSLGPWTDGALPDGYGTRMGSVTCRGHVPDVWDVPDGRRTVSARPVRTRVPVRNVSPPTPPRAG